MEMKVLQSCAKCVHVDKKPEEDPCAYCYGDFFEVAEENNTETITEMTWEEFVDGLMINRTKRLIPQKPLLTKNEYLALELTKVYTMQCCGQSKNGFMKDSIISGYEYFLKHFEDREKEET